MVYSFEVIKGAACKSRNSEDLVDDDAACEYAIGLIGRLKNDFPGLWADHELLIKAPSGEIVGQMPFDFEGVS